MFSNTPSYVLEIYMNIDFKTCFLWKKERNMLKKNLNKDLRAVHETYMNDFIKTISKKYKIEPQELRRLWKEQHSSCDRKTKKNNCLETTKKQQPSSEQQELWKSLCMLKYEDLSRHCLKNGIQPPLQKDDMIQAIIAKVCRS